jgi:S-layer homology domain
LTWTGSTQISNNPQQDVFFDKDNLAVSTPSPTPGTPCICTRTRTNTPISTPTASGLTATYTGTPTGGPLTPTGTSTRTLAITSTPTGTATSTFTGTPTFTPTGTATRTPTLTFTATPTFTPTGTATTTFIGTPTDTVTPCTIPFTDVLPSDYFYEAVRYLYCHGVISGYGTLFLPYNLTTRGQLTKIVILAEGWAIYLPPSPTFRDVPASHTFYQYIETAYRQGIISGYGCGAGCLEFHPGDNVTRGQLCKIVVLAEGWILQNPPNPTFRDVPATDPFYQHIETAYSHSIISGYGCGVGCLEFRPGSSATRGQICKIVYSAVTQP